MKKLILLFALLTMSLGVNAEISTSGLSAEQKAQLKLQVVKMQVAAEEVVIPKAEQVREWVEVGNAIGEGLAGAAGKLGVEVNTFADSTVGKFTMFIIAWTYVGQELITIMFGMLMIFFGIPVWLWMYRSRGSRRLTDETKYEKGKGPDGKTYVAHYVDTSEVTKGWYLAVLFATMILGTLSIIA